MRLKPMVSPTMNPPCFRLKLNLHAAEADGIPDHEPRVHLKLKLVHHQAWTISKQSLNIVTLGDLDYKAPEWKTCRRKVLSGAFAAGTSLRLQSTRSLAQAFLVCPPT